jgi:hypothetical protein
VGADAGVELPMQRRGTGAVALPCSLKGPTCGDEQARHAREAGVPAHRGRDAPREALTKMSGAEGIKMDMAAAAVVFFVALALMAAVMLYGVFTEGRR